MKEVKSENDTDTVIPFILYLKMGPTTSRFSQSIFIHPSSLITAEWRNAQIDGI